MGRGREAGTRGPKIRNPRLLSAVKNKNQRRHVFRTQQRGAAPDLREARRRERERERRSRERLRSLDPARFSSSVCWSLGFLTLT